MVMVMAWTLFGIAFYLLAGSVQEVSVSEIPRYMLVLTLSFLASFGAFFAPVGLGVREGVVTFLLGFWLPAPFPALVAIMSRVVLVAAELVGATLAIRL